MKKVLTGKNTLALRIVLMSHDGNQHDKNDKSKRTYKKIKVFEIN